MRAISFISSCGALLLAAALVSGCATLSGDARAPDEGESTPDAVAAPEAFKLRIDVDDAALRTLVARHTALKRWRAVSDLDATEIQRLMALAEDDTRELLATAGYFSPTVRADATGRALDARPTVVITITPGPAATVSAVDIAFDGDIATDGDTPVAAQRAAIAAQWELPAGKRFTQERWQDAKTAALRLLVAERYPRGRIAESSAVVDAANARVALSLRLDSGPTVHLGRAEVTGAARYPATLPERLTWLRPGAVYEQKALADAQQRLVASGYYDSAWISIAPEGEDQGDPGAVPVSYAVTEAKRHKVQLGLGYSTDSGPRLALEHRDNTAFGTTWRGETRLHLDRKQPLIQAELDSMPHADGWREAVFARHMRQDDGVLTTLSQTLRVGRLKTEEHFDRHLYLQYEQANVSGSGSAAVPAALLGDGAALSANVAWTTRRFEQLPNPSRGQGLALELGAGLTTMGTRRPFTRVQARWLGIVPLGETPPPSRRGRIQLRAEAAAILAKFDARLPSTALFRTGGDATVRGYGLRRIGLPVGAGLVAPGRVMAVASAEWQRPVLQERYPGLLEHVVFIDVGAVANHASDLRAHWGVGTGVRLITPVGPMQLDIARGLQSREWRLHMNVGFSF